MRFLRYSVIFLRFIIYMSSYWVHDLKSFVGQCNIRLILYYYTLRDSLTKFIRVEMRMCRAFLYVNITETSPYLFGNFRKLSFYNGFMPNLLINSL